MFVQDVEAPPRKHRIGWLRRSQIYIFVGILQRETSKYHFKRRTIHLLFVLLLWKTSTHARGGFAHLRDLKGKNI